MKSFKNKNAMTLVELIISVFISSTIILIVMTFMTTSLNELRVTNETTEAIDTTFTIKDDFARYVKWWYQSFDVYWQAWENSSILLYDDIGWILYWIVNHQSWKIQKEKIYWNNYVWRRLISFWELTTILADTWSIYDLKFQDDKIYKWVRIKDFNAELYNWWQILDMYISAVLVVDENNFWKKISDMFFDRNELAEFNLTF